MIFQETAVGAASRSGRLGAASIHLNDLQRSGLDTFQATHIDRRRRGSRRVGAESERRAAASWAKMVLDDVLVESVRGEIALRRQNA